MPAMARVAHVEESAEVEVLMANMDKLKTLTKKVQSSLNRLEMSGKNVQDAIRPIHGNTGKLQVMNRNIDKINVAINKIRQPLDRSGSEEKIIRAGLANVALQDYLASMDRAQQALGDLNNSNMRSNQQLISEITELIKFGRRELDAGFRDTLVEETKPVEPLHYLTKGLPFPTLSEGNSSRLRAINSYLWSGKQADPDSKTVASYAKIRGPYIASSLSTLSMASVSTIRKTQPDALYKAGQSGFGTYCGAFEKMLSAEHQSICPIFAREQWNTVHTITSEEALKTFIKVLRDLHQHVKAYIITDCYLAYEAYDVAQELAYTLEALNPELKQPILDAARPIKETAKYSLSRLLEDTASKVQGINILPTNSAPVPVTGEIVTRLHTMASYLHSLSKILGAVGDGGWKSNNANGAASSLPETLDVGAEGATLFANYAADTMEALMTALEMKARMLIKSKGAQGVFLANNFSLIDRTIAGRLISDSSAAKLDKWRKRTIDMYVKEWNSLAILLHDITPTNRASNPNRPQSGTQDSAAFVRNLSKAEKEKVKSNFKNFNAEFEDLFARHGNYYWERDVKPVLGKEVQLMLEPLYNRYYDRYHEIDKGKGKTVVYTKLEMARRLGRLAI